MEFRINWVCDKCATERGARVPDGHAPTWHIGECDLCGEQEYVTEPRDYGKTRHLIEYENND